MRNPKHTPGPWHWTETGRLEPVNTAQSRSIAAILNNDGCMVYRDAPAGWDDEQAENVALIAAAPDLFAVLAAIVDEIDRRGLCLNDAPRLCAIDEGLIVQAMAALEKATGGAA